MPILCPNSTVISLHSDKMLYEMQSQASIWKVDRRRQVFSRGLTVHECAYTHMSCLTEVFFHRMGDGRAINTSDPLNPSLPRVQSGDLPRWDQDAPGNASMHFGGACRKFQRTHRVGRRDGDGRGRGQ